MYLSKSSLNTWLMCPAKFKRLYIDKEKTTKSIEAQRGIEVHDFCNLFYDNLINSTLLTRIYRVSMVTTSLSVALTGIILSFFYYRHILIKRLRVSLEYIIYFYALSVIMFGIFYLCLYLLEPKFFNIVHPIYVVSQTWQRPPYYLKCEFVLFSAFTSVNGSYYRIHANSAIVSLMTYIQSIYTIALLSLFIASYVNQKTKTTGI